MLNELVVSTWLESVTADDGKGNDLFCTFRRVLMRTQKMLSNNLCVYFVGENIGADNCIVERSHNIETPTQTQGILYDIGSCLNSPNSQRDISCVSISQIT